MSATGVAGEDVSGRAGHQTGYGTRFYQAYVLNALFLIYLLNLLDRGLLNIVSEYVITELKLTDFQFGLLTGPAFGVFYSLVAVPLAMISERGSRVWLMTICIIVWSAATALCGLAQPVDLGFMVLSGFAVLFAFRMMVGIGEAGCTPPASSLIADYFPPERRAAAMGYYAMGVSLSGVASNLIGGPMTSWLGWRPAFWFIGVVGILMAVVFRMTVKEPPRGYSDPPHVKRPERARFMDVFRELLGKPTFWFMVAAASICQFLHGGLTSYQVSFARRTFGLTQNEATLMFNLPIALVAGLGTFVTGWIASRIFNRHPRAIAWLPAFGLAAAIPFYWVGFGSQNWIVALVMISIAAALKNAYLAAQYAIAQGVVGPQGRATATALLLMVGGMIAGFGPPWVGGFSDMIFGMKAEAAGFLDLARTSCRGEALAALSSEIQAFCRTADAASLQQTLVWTSLLLAAPACLFVACMRWMIRDMDGAR
jgi:predicted MFS family arabinose efflux permease